MRLATAAFGLLVLAAPAFAELPALDTNAIEACLTQQAESDSGDFSQCVWIGSSACLSSEGGMSTAGQVNCLSDELDFWDAKLDATHRAALEGAQAIDKEMVELGSAAPSLVEALEGTRTSWQEYMKNSCGLAAALFGGGSGAGPAAQACAVEMTAAQYFHLLPYASLQQ